MEAMLPMAGLVCHEPFLVYNAREPEFATDGMLNKLRDANPPLGRRSAVIEAPIAATT